MQEIDQQKLSEFTNELSAFQIEASKTASIDVYDRFTISKLEDHLVDLCQLSIDASHAGLQYLCERLRDNIRDHFITGTNISVAEFSLMTEWKSLVKAYLLNNDNEKIVTALAANLSKPGWTYPLNSDDTDEVISVLLNKSIYNSAESESNNAEFNVDDSEELDSLLGESNASLADVFESLNDNEEVIDEAVVSLPDEKESSISEFFEDNSSSADIKEVSKNSSEFKANEKEEPIVPKQSVEDELPEIDEEITQTLPNDLLAADENSVEADYQVNIDKDMLNAEAAFAHNLDESINKIEVSKQELEEIDEAVVDSVVDELHVEGDEAEYNDDFNKEISDAKTAFTKVVNESDDKIEVSKQELEEIDEAIVDSVVDELHVEDDEAEYNDDFNKEISDAKTAFTKVVNEPDDKIEVSKQELDDINKTVANSIENKLFVSAADANELPNDEEFDVNLQESQAILDQSTVEKTSQIEDEHSDDESVTDSLVDELFVADNDEDKPESNQAFDKDLSEAASLIESSDVEKDYNESSSDSKEDLQAVDEKETVYIETAEKEKAAPRSIIEAYVGVIADKMRTNKPKELEQELIKAPPKPPPIQKLEPVDSILLKYSDWNEEQKELLSLILSEVHDVIEQQDDVLSVLHKDEISEQNVLDMVCLYSEQIERMGSAAEMVGLDALQKLCELIGFHFGDLEKSSTDMIISSEEQIRKWPFIIHNYLKDIHNEKYHQEVIEYISNDEWARTIREDIKADLKQALSNSTIHIEKTEEDKRITKASAEDVDITVPDDVQAELLDGLLQELPHQTEEFSKSIQGLIKDDYLSQLEVTQRIAHTIKGAANTVGIVGVATLTHHLEDILQSLLKAQAKPNAALHMALIDASDCLEQMTECLLEQGEQPDDAMQIMQVILDWANYIDEFGPPKDDANKVVASANTSESEQKEKTSATESDKKDKAKSSQDSSLRVPAIMIDELINQSGESIIATSQMHENVNKLLSSMRDIKKNKDSVYSLSQQLEHLIDVQGTNEKFSNSTNDEKFDPLELDQYNELHTYSRRLIEATADSVELIKDMEERLFSLESVIADQTRAQKDNQYAILKTRMMPVETIVARLKRGVRQAAKISGKSVELQVSGSDTLLDSKILNNLLDPLMHILRNAVDHGIESDEVRDANDKPLPGIINLSFSQTGERLEIYCKDDGQGLNIEEIKSRAIDKGMVLNEQDLTDDEVQQIIMQHGFSTRDEVTQLSGRGVGMDVVYSSIKELNGSVAISSEPNKGMNVELSLPVSLLTAHALLIPTMSGSMAVSTSGIEEILQVNLDDLKETEQGLILKLENQEYPAIHIEQLLKMPLSVSSNKQKNFSALLIDELSGQKKVVLVNEIQSVRDIVIKPFSRYLPKVIGLVGATVLGNGDIAPVVDVCDLLAQQSNLVGKINIHHSTDLEEIHQASVLVVEDSISTRRSLAEFMQDLNYKVFTAKDGVEAIEVMRDHSPTILLTDLEMPRMNGLELTSYVRSHDETKDIPIIMLTSRTTEKHRQEAKSIGVNEYLSKPFVEDVLLEKIQGLAILK
ncbi:MAG: response regulator [Gammaproteobacteria bacterium]|nr:response regulator [Gammaproteobacteria bacterium]